MIQNIPLNKITISSLNPRFVYDQQELQNLADTIKTLGVIQPITVYKKDEEYVLVTRTTRFKASKIAGKTDIPAYIREFKSDDEIAQVALAENIQRQNTNPLEEAKIFKTFIDSGLSEEQTSKALGVSAFYIRQRKHLNNLIDEYQKQFLIGDLDLADALLIARASSKQQKQFIKDDLDIYDIKSILRQNRNKLTSELNWEETTAKYPPCTGCIYNNHTASLFQDELDSIPICSNSKCFSLKFEVLAIEFLAKAIQDPQILFLETESTLPKLVEYLKSHNAEILDITALKTNYSQLFKPKIPILSEYQERFTTGQYDSEEEMQNDYNEDLTIYERNNQEYLAQLNSNIIFKVLNLDTENFGNLIYCIKKSGKTKSSQDLKNLSEKDKNIQVKQEITRIQDREKRNKELDREKATVDIYNVLENNSDTYKMSINNISQELKQIEKLALIHYLYQSSDYKKKEEVTKLIKECFGSDYDLLKNKFITIAEDGFNKFIRLFLLKNWRHGLDYGKSEDAFIAYKLLEEHDPNCLKLIMNKYLIIREKRNEKIKERISKLNKIT